MRPDQSSERSGYDISAVEPFPVILHRLLHEVEGVEGGNSIISWNLDGKSFSIHNPKEFCEHVMGRYFKNQTRYKSFQRQLNLYRFKRHKAAYSHKAFVRDDPSLLRFVKRVKSPAALRKRSYFLTPEMSSSIPPTGEMQYPLLNEIRGFSDHNRGEPRHEAFDPIGSIPVPQQPAHYSNNGIQLSSWRVDEPTAPVAMKTVDTVIMSRPIQRSRRSYVDICELLSLVSPETSQLMNQDCGNLSIGSIEDIDSILLPGDPLNRMMRNAELPDEPRDERQTHSTAPMDWYNYYMGQDTSAPSSPFN